MSAGIPTTGRATLADLARTPGKAELIGGRIVPLMPTGLRPNLVAGRIYRSLADHVDAIGRGVALTDNLGFAIPTWESSPQGITTGSYGLSIRTEDIARFGQLYLQKGLWEGKQLAPTAWVQAATARQTSNGSNPPSDWEQGYGYQFWRCRHNAYRGDGVFGQFCIVLPEQDAVIAISSAVKNMQAVVNLVWDKLLPALNPAPLAADDESRKRLDQTLAGLSLHPQDGSASPARVSNKRFEFPSNDRKLEAITLSGDPKDDVATLVARFDGVDHPIPCGRGIWRKGRLAYGVLPEQPAAASGAWTEDDTFTAKLCFFETPFIIKVNLNFSGDQVLYSSESNVGFGSPKRLQLVGKSE